VLRILGIAAVAVATLLLVPRVFDGDAEDPVALPVLPVASVEEFCTAFLDPFPLMDLDDPDGRERAGAWDFGANQREYAARMLAAGLPPEAGRRVRAGLQVFADLSGDMPANLLKTEPEDLPQPTAEQDASYRAFDRWSRRTCGRPY
jgi:hypothetical protein